MDSLKGHGLQIIDWVINVRTYSTTLNFGVLLLVEIDHVT